MPVIDLMLAIIVCICIGIIYTIVGYNVTELFTDGPNWKPWEQCAFWLFWPLIIPAFFAVLIAIVLVAVFVSIFLFFGLIFYLFKKIFSRNK